MSYGSAFSTAIWLQAFAIFKLKVTIRTYVIEVYDCWLLISSVTLGETVFA